MNPATTACYRFNVTGRVQGVYFRQATRQRALELGVRGWVRNCDDGSVEGMAAGETAALKSLQRWLHQGPPAARVDRVAWSAADAQEFDGFEIMR
jgi:acylphosphatase